MSIAAVTRARFRVRGTVQGVGFRPFVYRHAMRLGLAGFVRNDSDGVLLEVQGHGSAVDELARVLVDEPPPRARVAEVVRSAVPALLDSTGFRIEHSVDLGEPAVPVGADTATCAACLAEVDDPADRRFRYPFTNCTDCGPRYTIVLSVPYDRPATTMAGFAMCTDCRREYDDPSDRRFHAQPNACPVCGPTLTWRRPDGTALATGDTALVAAVDALRAGSIVAVKGVGGYHLAVDASDERAVAELRRRKSRDDKPFAVMVESLDAARVLCVLDERAEEALASAARPIVVAPAQPGGRLATGVVLGAREVGLFLPYSAMHHLLLAGAGRALVLTSGNLTDEPIAHDDLDAIARLGPMADALLTHDRPIHIRCDDSVARSGGARVQLLRRSRGAAPQPMSLPVSAAVPVLAVGAELKSTVAVAKGNAVVASHHIGDLEHLATYRSFLQAIEHLTRLCGVEPRAVAHDLHPEYLSTKLALDLDLPVVGVQHHHAHVASCMVEHGRTEPVLAIAFDGLGFGLDGTLWGGELLAADLTGAERAGHLRTVPMPGGVAAILEPWRMAASWLHAAIGDGAATILESVDARVSAVTAVVASGTAPVTSSAGRLFDAAAVLLGCRPRVTFEAQAAVELETLARSVERRDAPTYAGTVAASGGVLDPTALVATLVDERRRGVPPAVVAAGFHEALGRAVAALAAELAGVRGLDTVVLTGGVFQNVRLTGVVETELLGAGLRVLAHEQVPPNDGGISIGQAAVAAARLRS